MSPFLVPIIDVMTKFELTALTTFSSFLIVSIMSTGSSYCNCSTSIISPMSILASPPDNYMAFLLRVFWSLGIADIDLK